MSAIPFVRSSSAVISAPVRQHSSALDLADRLVNDPSASHWLRRNIVSLLAVDAVDAVNDCELLLSIVTARLEEIQAEAGK